MDFNSQNLGEWQDFLRRNPNFNQMPAQPALPPPPAPAQRSGSAYPRRVMTMADIGLNPDGTPNLATGRWSRQGDIPVGQSPPRPQAQAQAPAPGPFAGQLEQMPAAPPQPQAEPTQSAPFNPLQQGSKWSVDSPQGQSLGALGFGTPAYGRAGARWSPGMAVPAGFMISPDADNPMSYFLVPQNPNNNPGNFDPSNALGTRTPQQEMLIRAMGGSQGNLPTFEQFSNRFGQGTPGTFVGNGRGGIGIIDGTPGASPSSLFNAYQAMTNNYLTGPLSDLGMSNRAFNQQDQLMQRQRDFMERQTAQMGAETARTLAQHTIADNREAAQLEQELVRQQYSREEVNRIMQDWWNRRTNMRQQSGIPMSNRPPGQQAPSGGSGGATGSTNDIAPVPSEIEQSLHEMADRIGLRREVGARRAVNPRTGQTDDNRRVNLQELPIDNRMTGLAAFINEAAATNPDIFTEIRRDPRTGLVTNMQAQEQAAAARRFNEFLSLARSRWGEDAWEKLQTAPIGRVFGYGGFFGGGESDPVYRAVTRMQRVAEGFEPGITGTRDILNPHSWSGQRQMVRSLQAAPIVAGALMAPYLRVAVPGGGMMPITSGLRSWAGAGAAAGGGALGGAVSAPINWYMGTGAAPVNPLAGVLGR